MSVKKMIPRVLLLHIITGVTACVFSLSICAVHLLYVSTINLLHDQWKNSKLVVIPKDHVSGDKIKQFIDKLNMHPDVFETQVISSEEGWNMLHDDRELIPAMKMQGDNALPDVILVSPLLKTWHEFNMLVEELHKEDLIEKIAYNAPHIKQLISHAGSFQFVMKSLVWILSMLIIGMLLMIIRFLLIPQVMNYTAIVLQQTAAGGVSAYIGWFIFSSMFYGIAGMKSLITKESLFSMLIGMVIGFCMGIFIIVSYAYIRSEYPAKRMASR
ncbi:MAG: hypothetical protein ABII23_00050 [bacterium]